MLSIPQTSADIERLSSRDGRIVTDSRSSFFPGHVNDLQITQHYRLKETEERLHDLAGESAVPYAKMKATKIYKKFKTLGLDVELHDPVVFADDSDDEGKYVKDSGLLE